MMHHLYPCQVQVITCLGRAPRALSGQPRAQRCWALPACCSRPLRSPGPPGPPWSPWRYAQMGLPGAGPCPVEAVLAHLQLLHGSWR